MPIYLDHASTSWPKAPGVADAMLAALALPGSAHRGGGPGALGAQGIDDALRAALATEVHAPDPRRIVLTSGATESLNIALLGAVRAAHSGGVARPRIVTTQIEHNAVRRPLLALHAAGQIDLEIVPASQDTLISPLLLLAEAAGAGGRPPAALVAMTWACNVTGAIQPVEQIAGGLRGTPTLLLVDASQTVGLVRSSTPLDRLGIDMLAFSGHKALGGPPGVGALYLGPRAHPIDDMRASRDRERDAATADNSPRVLPVLLGGTGAHSEAADMPAALPHRFEPGTANTPARAGLLAAIENRPPSDTALSSVRALATLLRERLRRTHGVTIAGPSRAPPDEPGTTGVVAFCLDAFSPDEVAAILDAEFGIIVRPGLHCAPGAHEAMGTLSTGGTVRASVGLTTTPDDIAALTDALQRLTRS